MKRTMDDGVSRRNFLKNFTFAAATLPATLRSGEFSGRSPNEPTRSLPRPRHQTMIGVPFAAKRYLRIGIIGLGNRGNVHLKILLAIENVEITALCDIVPSKVLAAQETLRKAGRNLAATYTNGQRDYEHLCRRDDVDVVYVVTPWEWHVPMAVCTMTNGKHAFVEIPAANTLSECWELVNVSEATRQHCVMLENCCFDYNEMMVLNMIRLGVFGEVKHGGAAYIHDLRKVFASDVAEGLWRRFSHTTDNGNLYPTHGLGPVANYMKINRGDRFDYLVSMSSPEFNLSLYIKENTPLDSPKRIEKYICGDMNTSMIKTTQGRTIVLEHDVVSPRPYDRINLISGTKATFRDYPARLFVDGQKEHDWQTIDLFKERYEHPLWTREGDRARSVGGHGGMDYLMNLRLVRAIQGGLVPDMDVYDAAALSAPKPLSAASLAQGSSPQSFPDFTRGSWVEAREPIAL